MSQSKADGFKLGHYQNVLPLALLLIALYYLLVKRRVAAL